MNEKELIAEYARLECQLSPENLHMDGERPRSQALALGRRYQARQKQIEKQLGRVPSHTEMFGR